MNTAAAMLIDIGGASDISAVGGKAYQLFRLQTLGVPTPGGTVVPNHVFENHLQHSGVSSHIEQLSACRETWDDRTVDATCGIIRRGIVDTQLEPDFRNALNDAFQHRWQKKVLAVRSSAHGEDAAGTSMAGQLDSFLDIDSVSALEQAIKAVWASLFSTRVLRYTRHTGKSVNRMGVIVQPQVNAQRAGVLFTRDPGSRQPDSMLVEHCVGLGEAVVSGSITPSRARVRRSNLALTVEHTAKDDDILDADAVKAIKQIAQIAMNVETAQGVAQDIEWCIDACGKPVFVQARPVTQLVSSDGEQRVHWTNANIAENYPEPVSPFLFSIVQPGYSAYFRNLGIGFGVSRKRVEAMTGSLDHIVGVQGGRLYYNLSNIHLLLLMMPAGHKLVEFFNLFVGAEDIPAPPVVDLGLCARIAETINIAGSVFWQYLFIQRRIRRFENKVDEFAGRTHPQALMDKDADELIEDLDGFLDIRMRQWNGAALADTAAMICYGVLKAALTSTSPDGDDNSIHNDLLKGLPDLASAVPVEKLWQLSRRIGEDEALKTLFLSNDAEKVFLDLSYPRYSEFKRAFDEYLDKWGYRSSSELMLTTTTPQEDPLPVLRLLRNYVRSQAPSPADVAEAQQQERLAATATVLEQQSPLPGWRRIPVLSAAGRFRSLLNATQGAIKLRERARMKQALLYTRLRHIALNLGDHLVRSGAIEERADVFMLTTSEVKTLLQGKQNVEPGITALIRARREELNRNRMYEPPDSLNLNKGEQWTVPDDGLPRADETADAGTLRGNGACGGTAVGRAAVVLDVAHAHCVESGDILVTRQTDPGWATVFFLVKGLVIERGGMLSHGAIIAREYGIPAVIGVPDATRLIKDGESILVNGDEGFVEIGYP